MRVRVRTNSSVRIVSMQPYYHACRNGTFGCGSCQTIRVLPVEPIVWVSPPDRPVSVVSGSEDQHI